jgi:valyl-tRNA synthetase
LQMIDEQGADAVRMGMLLCSPAGNDILFDISQVEQGRNFCNKIWNAYRLVMSWESTENASDYYQNYHNAIQHWMESKLNNAIIEINEHFERFRLSDALMTIYKLIWDDFCAWYLEMMKPPYGEPIYKASLVMVKSIFIELMKLLHPFMPFISEEISQGLKDETDHRFINTMSWPLSGNETIPTNQAIFELITLVRNKRNENGISPKIAANLFISTTNSENYKPFEGIAKKLANLEQIQYGKMDNGLLGLVGKDEITIQFIGWEMKALDKTDIQKEIDYLEGFLQSVGSKLNNEKFMANAKPELIEKELQKKADAESKITTLKMQLSN